MAIGCLGCLFLARYVHINKTHHFWLNRTFEHEMSPLGIHTTYGLYLFSLVSYNNSSMCFANPRVFSSAFLVNFHTSVVVIFNYTDTILLCSFSHSVFDQSRFILILRGTWSKLVMEKKKKKNVYVGKQKFSLLYI